MWPFQPVFAFLIPESLVYLHIASPAVGNRERLENGHPAGGKKIRIDKMDKLWIFLFAISFVCASNNASLTTLSPIGTNLTTTSTTEGVSSAPSVIEIVIIGLGLILLLFVAIRMTTMVRQYNNAGPTSGMTGNTSLSSLRRIRYG